jgi:hypothetical protein
MLKAVAEVVKIEKASWRFDQFVPGGILFRSYAAFFSFSANRSIASSNLPITRWHSFGCWGQHPRYHFPATALRVVIV